MQEVSRTEADRTHCLGENGKEWVFVPRLPSAGPEAGRERSHCGFTLKGLLDVQADRTGFWAVGRPYASRTAEETQSIITCNDRPEGGYR